MLPKRLSVGGPAESLLIFVMARQSRETRKNRFSPVTLRKVSKGGLPGFGKKTLRKRRNLSSHSLGSREISA